MSFPLDNVSYVLSESIARTTFPAVTGTATATCTPGHRVHRHPPQRLLDARPGGPFVRQNTCDASGTSRNIPTTRGPDDGVPCRQICSIRDDGEFFAPSARHEFAEEKRLCAGSEAVIQASSTHEELDAISNRSKRPAGTSAARCGPLGRRAWRCMPPEPFVRRSHSLRVPFGPFTLCDLGSDECWGLQGGGFREAAGLAWAESAGWLAAA